MSIELEILEIAKKVFQKSEEQIKVEYRFKGGMSNYTYLVHVSGIPYVIRKIGDGGELLVNPAIEKEHLALIQPLKISSDVVYFDVNTGIKVSTYVEGEPLSTGFTENDFALVAKELRTLHESNLPGHDYELKNRLRRYEKLLKHEPGKLYYQLKMQWLKLYDDYYGYLPKVFCHGDAQRSNLVKHEQKIYLLDWEFAGLNDPFYDIASFGNIDFNDSLKLLEFYLDRKPTHQEYQRVRFYRMFQVLQWHIVATYKHEIGLSEKLHLDFEKIAQKYLLMAENFNNELKDDRK